MYRASIYRNDLLAILSEWADATKANFLLRGARQKKIRQTLEPFVEGSVPVDPSKDLVILIELAAIEKKLEPLAPTLDELGLWAGFQTDAAQLEFLLTWSVNTREVMDALRSPTIGADALNKHVFRLMTERAHLFDEAGSARVAFNALQRAWASAEAAQERVRRLAGRIKPARPIASGPHWIDNTVDIVRRWQANLHRAQAWCNWNDVKAKVADAGLSPITDALEEGKLGVEEIENAFEVAYARWWSDQIVTKDPILRSFLATRHEDTIARFKAADQRIGELSRRIVRARLGGQVPLPMAFGTDPEWGALSRELAKKARQMPLRQLFSNIAAVLAKLTPCVMMSPLSIAQYLPAESQAFDVVIFDEASQIPVWDAIGAIARGRQVVIVGDPDSSHPPALESGVSTTSKIAPT